MQLLTVIQYGSANSHLTAAGTSTTDQSVILSLIDRLDLFT
jgi:hypothetical protein